MLQLWLNFAEVIFQNDLSACCTGMEPYTSCSLELSFMRTIISVSLDTYNLEVETSVLLGSAAISIYTVILHEKHFSYSE